MIKTYQVLCDNYEDAGQASRDIKSTLKSIGLDPKVLKRISIACYEAEINLVIHSLGGTITFRIDDEGTVHLNFDDVGPGIPDIEKAMTPDSRQLLKKLENLDLGQMGLDNMKKCATTFHIESSSEGTHLEMSFEMKEVVSYLNTRCDHCIKCLKSCPTDAISIVNGKVLIDDEKCIYCDVCVKECPTRSLKVQGSHLNETLHLHDYNVVLIPTSLLSDLKSFEEFQKICQAVLKLGFDEVEQYSDIEGFLYKKAIEESHQKEGVWLTSFCPTINQLIEKNYPTLYEHILPYDYPVEIAARMIRKKHKNKNIGIYSLCECVGKMTLAKEPFGNADSAIDYALTISHVFPKINKLKSDQKYTIEMNKYGVKSNVEDLFGNRSLSVVRVEGLNQSKSLLDLIEFDQIQHVDLVAMYACYQGCIGGHYLWSNPFEGCYNIESMLDDCTGNIADLKEEEYIKTRHFNRQDILSMKERMAWFNKVNEVLETLPQFDCGACGFANCRSLAQSVVEGKLSEDACVVLRKGGRHENQ